METTDERVLPPIETLQPGQQAPLASQGQGRSATVKLPSLSPAGNDVPRTLRGTPVFRLAVHQSTYLGPSMRRSQWEPLETRTQLRRRNPGAAANSGSASAPELGAAERSTRAAACNPWKPGHWAAGRQFGAPPMSMIDNKTLRRRIDNLRNGVLLATEEAEMFTGTKLMDELAYRGKLLAGRAELERELDTLLLEQDRRSKLPAKPKKRRRRSVLPEDA
eukprot:TRINITY_DN83651_c0_g1_i1.p1 TRINITY_DN83651_c0_g1~~TRINITY_DN83651_c0_g1_i1.p1  ORF type:complete len:220 (+),score=19.09 TRINITY_DN83651_c0_g1_i1:131-790(+)